MDKMRLFWEHLQRWTWAIFFWLVLFNVDPAGGTGSIQGGRRRAFSPLHCLECSLGSHSLWEEVWASCSVQHGSCSSSRPPSLLCFREPLRHLALLSPAHLCISAYSPPSPGDISSPQRCKSVHLLSSFLMPLLPTEALMPMKMAH